MTKQKITSVVCAYYIVDYERIRGYTKSPKLNKSRKVVAFFLKKKGFTLKEIASFLGGRDYQLIRYYIKRVQEMGIGNELQVIERNLTLTDINNG